MKKICFALAILFVLAGNVSGADKYDAAMKEIRAEKKVIDATWGPIKGPSLFVAVKDDGSRRDGFAQYLCLVLKDHNISGVIIHIMTYKNFLKYNTKKDIGYSHCK